MAESPTNDAGSLSGLPSELRTACLDWLEANSLIPLMLVSKDFHALIDSILRQRFFDLITPSRVDPDLKAVIKFESSAPSDPTK